MQAIGFSSDIWVGWKKSVHVEIISNHPQFILIRAIGVNVNQLILISLVYGSPNRLKKKNLWEGLRNVIPSSNIPWLAIRDFNAILSPNDKKVVVWKE